MSMKDIEKKREMFYNSIYRKVCVRFEKNVNGERKLMIQADKRKEVTRKIFLDYLPMAVTGICLLVSSIIVKQMPIKVLPTLISLLVMLLSAKANRFTFLLGAANSVLYIIGYFMEGLYGQVALAAFGIVTMLVAYFSWKKDSYGKSTIFRVFKLKGKLILTLVLLTAWAVTSFVLWKLGGTAVVFDGLSMALSFTVSILNIWGYIESPILNVVNTLIQMAIWLQIIFTNGNVTAGTYFVSSLYNVDMVTRTAIKWCALYKEQQAKNKA